ncbi:LemA family protein [Aliamphritea ceti]|uniref:LemA family protein n=1 Tax=Aliamphritea ceti TaxID=1524258 RepID=UPI0021C2E14E|nr:LemA family protein [Aliamphritea ceti]
MNTLLSSIITVLLILILPILVCVYFYNSAVNKDEAVFSAWAQVESNYQRRADLIPNLVKTLSAFMNHERNTLESITTARAGDNQKMEQIMSLLMNASQDGEQMMAENALVGITDKDFLQAYDVSQSKIGGLMNKLIATVESYPELRSNDQILALQAQLEGSENRINIARINYNQHVEAFNRSIRGIPGSFIASIGSFKRKEYFQSDNGSNERVSVELD